MGYTTDFVGTLKLDRELSHREWLELKELGDGYEKSDYEKYTDTPETIPDSYLQWVPNEDGTGIVWNGGEKFYNYIQWLRWLIKHYLKPHGLTLDGQLQWQGEEPKDIGLLKVDNNVVTLEKLKAVCFVECPNCGESFKPNED